MNWLRKRFEVRSHHVSWGLGALLLLAAMGALLSGEIVTGVHILVLALLFSMAAWGRCGKLIPVFGLGLLVGLLLSPIAQHDDYNELQQIALFAAGGIVGLGLGVIVSLLDFYSRHNANQIEKTASFDERIFIDEQP